MLFHSNIASFCFPDLDFFSVFGLPQTIFSFTPFFEPAPLFRQATVSFLIMAQPPPSLLAVMMQSFT